MITQNALAQIWIITIVTQYYLFKNREANKPMRLNSLSPPYLHSNATM